MDNYKIYASEQFVNEQISTIKDGETLDSFKDVETVLTTKAPIESPSLTGTPTAPTASADTNTTQIATTAFVKTATNALKSDLENGTNITVKNAETASGLDTTGVAQVKAIKVDNATSADTADKVAQSLTIGKKTYNGSSHVEISAGDLGLESAVRFVGITATAITDGGTQSPVIDGETHVPIRGDVVINSNTDQEFIWNGSAWEEMGNSSSHALKTISISAGDGLTGGGTLEANRTISHADTSTQASVSANGRRYITGVTLDTYGHVTGLTTGTETVTDTDTKVTQAAVITTNGAYPVLLGYSTATTEVTNTVNKSSKITFNPSTGQLAISGADSTSTTTGALKVTGGIGASGNIYSSAVYGAVWNDYAEYREGTAQFEPGRVICENGDDTLSLATERLQPGANVVSDTFGFAIGETENAKTPIAVSGRVLAYPYEDRNSYNPGDAVCAAPNGTVSKMTREEIREYPERIIGTVSAIPEYETWGTGNVPVNGRIWIKIK